MRAFIYLHFPEQKTFSPERIVRSLTAGLPVYAEVRYPATAVDAFAEVHEPTQIEFRAVCVPQSAMTQAMQSGSVRVTWDDFVWKVSEARQEDDGSLTLTAGREKRFVRDDRDAVYVGTEQVEIGDDTPVLRAD